MKLYLAGPINGCTDAECNTWRSAVKRLHADWVDPMSRDYRGREAENCDAIVLGDKADIDRCDALIVWYERKSDGTPMEILYAWERRKPIAIINRSGKPLSPWLQYHTTYVCSSVEDAVHRLGNHTR